MRKIWLPHNSIFTQSVTTTKIKTAYKLLLINTAYILFLINTAYKLFLGGNMNYTINTLEQLKPILVGFRKSNGLSQKALAQRLGISQQSYQALESAPQKVTLERLFKVLAILGIKLQFVDSTRINESTLNGVEDSNQQQDEW